VTSDGGCTSILLSIRVRLEEFEEELCFEEAMMHRLALPLFLHRVQGLLPSQERCAFFLSNDEKNQKFWEQRLTLHGSQLFPFPCRFRFFFSVDCSSIHHRKHCTSDV
jgi:hypothetical protein